MGKSVRIHGRVYRESGGFKWIDSSPNANQERPRSLYFSSIVTASMVPVNGNVPS